MVKILIQDNPKRKYNIVFLLLALVFLRCSGQVDNERSPNVVFILADDLGYGDLSYYGQTKFTTPNIDALAQGGLVFTQHYSGSTVCAPSRSSLLTGLHTGHTFIRGNKEVQPEGQYPLADSVLTLAEIFKSKGYATGMFGKWGLGYPGSEGDPMNQGFDTFTGFNCQRLGHNYYPPYLWYNDKKVMIPENDGTGNGSYAPERIHQSALEFIATNKEKPFFLYVPSIIPHAELVAPERYMEKYRGKFGEETAYHGPDPSDKTFKKGGYTSQADPKAAFAAMVTLLDDQIGEIVHALKKSGLFDNTIIIFTSDNGPHIEGGANPDYFNSNGALRGYKRDLYEGGIRVPLIIHWPAKVKPGKTNHVSAFWDFVPTFSEIIGAEIGEVDGISFYPTLLGKTDQQEHQYLYWEFHEQGGKQALRKGNWKVLRLDVNDPEKTHMELFNIGDDISEMKDLSAIYPDTLRELEKLMTGAHKKNPVFQFGTEKSN
ncbi:MAG: arylsulfatase [Marivirga sp.]|nr:arylsulfatase [Marivirga sp.]